MPKVERVDLSPSPIHVGDELSVRVQLTPSTPLDSLLTSIDHHNGSARLDQLEERGLTSTFRAERPGRSEIEISLVDRKTLLSPKTI